MSHDLTRTMDDSHGDCQALLTGLPDDVREGLDEWYVRQQMAMTDAELDAMEVQHAQQECDKAARSTSATIANYNVNSAIDELFDLFLLADPAPKE